MTIVTRFFDGLANVVSGLGTRADKRSYGRYTVLPLTADQIVAAYRTSWMVRKGIDLPPTDMTHAGRDWQADKVAIGLLEKEEKRLQLWSKLRLGLCYGRLGGGAMILGVGREDPALPINPRALGQASLRYAKVYSRYRVQLGPEVTDPTDDWCGQPAYFTLSGSDGRQTRIHPSRVVAFRGKPVPDLAGASWEDIFWGDSVLQSVEDAIKNADAAQNGFASLIEEAKLDVYKIPGLTALAATAEYEASLSKRFQTSALFKSQFNALLLDAGNGQQGSGEEWETRQITWAGMPDIAKMYVAFVAGAFDIPATRFVGKSADGMNATGAGDENAYWAMIGTEQEVLLRPALDQVDAALIPSALGKQDEGIWWEFAPLREVSEKEEADTFNVIMAAVTKLQNTGTVPDIALAKGVQNLMEERGWIPGLDDALAEVPKDERFPTIDDPDLEETEGGDPDLAGAGSSEEAPGRRRRMAANDAKPRTLYVSRKLLNGAEFIGWAKGQGFTTTTPADELHVTIAFSRAAVDWMKMGGDSWGSDGKGKLEVAPGGARLVERLGDEGAVVLLFANSSLSWRHEEMKRNGASFDFDEYQPHVTITYEAPVNLDLAKVEPYRGKLTFGPEIFAEVEEDWEKTISEDGEVGDQPSRPFGDGSYEESEHPRGQGGRWTNKNVVQEHVTRALGSGKEHSTTSLGKVSEANATKVREQTGVDITGYERVLHSGDIRHVMNSHGDAGREAARGQQAIKKADFGNIRAIVERAHTISVAGDRKSRKGVRLTYGAKVGEHEYIYTEMLQGDQIVALKTMRKR